MNGSLGLTGQSPWAAWMSVWHNPEASILTTISPGPGSGLATSSRRSGEVNSCTTAACMLCSFMLCFSLCSGSNYIWVKLQTYMLCFYEATNSLNCESVCDQHHIMGKM